MRISSFLTFIIFCCLLFMEELTEAEAAGIRLFTQLRALRNRLRYLQIDIKKLEVSNNEAINDKIEGLIKMVDDDTKNWARKLPEGRKIRRKDIDIEEMVNLVQASIDNFFSSTDYSSKELDDKELDELLNKIEVIWKNQIQTKINRVIESPPL